jgi:hypothetical protein
MNKELLLQELKNITISISDNDNLRNRLLAIFEGSLDLNDINDKLYDIINYGEMSNEVREILLSLKNKVVELISLEATLANKELELLDANKELATKENTLVEVGITNEVKQIENVVDEQTSDVKDQIEEKDLESLSIEAQNKELETLIGQIKSSDLSQTKYFSDLKLEQIKEFMTFFDGQKTEEHHFQISIGRDLEDLDRRSIMMHYTSSNGQIEKDNVFVYVDYKDGVLFDQDMLPAIVGTYADGNMTKNENVHRGAIDGISSYINESNNGNKLVLFNMTNEAINNNRNIIKETNQKSLIKNNQYIKKPIITKPTNYVSGFADALLLAFLTGVSAGIIMMVCYFIIY